MKNLFEKINKVVLLIGIIVIIILITVSIIVFNNINKKEPTQNVEGQVVNHPSTEDTKDKAPLIDMNNMENVRIQNGEKVNSSEYMKRDKELPGLKITNISLRTENGLSNFNAIVENTTEEDFEGGAINLIFKKSDGTTLTNVGALIPPVKAKGFNTIDASTTQDITNAIDVKIELK